jgi:hypothetical protein
LGDVDQDVRRRKRHQRGGTRCLEQSKRSPIETPGLNCWLFNSRGSRSAGLDVR